MWQNNVHINEFRSIKYIILSVLVIVIAIIISVEVLYINRKLLKNIYTKSYFLFYNDTIIIISWSRIKRSVHYFSCSIFTKKCSRQ